MIKKLLMAALTTTLVAKGVQVLLRRADQRTRVQKKREKKSEVQRWENEGGPASGLYFRKAHYPHRDVDVGFILAARVNNRCATNTR